jgi:hypothetical protein
MVESKFGSGRILVSANTLNGRLSHHLAAQQRDSNVQIHAC